MFVMAGSRQGRGAAWNALYPIVAPMLVIPYQSIITLDFGFGRNCNFVIGSLTGNLTLANPVNMRIGQVVFIELPQDGTGSRTVSYGSFWKFYGGTPTASTAASSIDGIVAEVRSASLLRGTFNKAAA